MELWNTGKSKNPKFVASEVTAENGEMGFQVGWSINPHMKVGSACPRVAEIEHRDFIATLRDCGADVHEVPFIPGAYDSVFMKDNALLVKTQEGLRGLPARPYMTQRECEPLIRAKNLREQGWAVSPQPSFNFEGGDVFVCAQKKFALMGYGFRTSYGMLDELRRFLDCEVMPLALKDPYFYHLDTALNAVMIDDKCVVFAYPGAFTKHAWQSLNGHPDIDRVIEVEKNEAMKFGLNWVEVNDNVVIGSAVPGVEKALNELGKTVITSPLTQFRLAGGSAACLVAQVHELQ